jgi:hypothetical protein
MPNVPVAVAKPSRIRFWPFLRKNTLDDKHPTRVAGIALRKK